MILRDGNCPVTRETDPPEGHVDCATEVGNTASDLSDDQELEVAIDRAYDKLVAASTREAREHWCRIMYRMIGLRSPAQVSRMEARIIRP